MSAPLKGRLVLIYRHTIELNGPQQGSLLQREPALLPGIAQQHGIRENAVPQQFGGHGISIERAHPPGANRLGDVGGTLHSRVLPVAVVDKCGRGCPMLVESHPGAPLLHAQQGFT